MSLHTIVPNKLPPNVGRVTSNNDSPFSLAYSKSTSILVASAVRPTFKRAATRGAKSRPNGVAPVNIESGL